jgi:hypothetical protein
MKLSRVFFRVAANVWQLAEVREYEEQNFNLNIKL